MEHRRTTLNLQRRTESPNIGAVVSVLPSTRFRVALLLLGVVLARFSCEGAGENQNGKTTTVKRGRFEVNAVEDGVLRALHSTTITAKDRGKIEWLAPEGKTAKKGDVLARMETKKFEEDLDRYENDLKDAEAKLEELQEDFEKEKKDLEDEFAGLELPLKVAKLHLEMVQSRPTAADRAKAEADLKRTEVLMEDAQKERARREKLWEARTISRNEFQQATMLARIAAARHERQKLSYTQLCQGATLLEVEKAKLDLETAQLDYEVAKERLSSQIARLGEDLKKAEAKAERGRSDVRRTKMHIENRTLHAPHEGLVIYYQKPHGRSSRGKRKVDVGMNLWTGAAIIELPDLSRMKVRTQVSESVIRDIHLDKEAIVRANIDEVRDIDYHGKIIWIDKAGRDRNSRLEHSERQKEGLAGINVFDVQVEIEEVDERLRLDAKAKVTIPLKKIDDAVYVAKEGIRIEDGRPQVWVLENGDTVKKSVQLGEENETDVVILSGLAGGETVLVK